MLLPVASPLRWRQRQRGRGGGGAAATAAAASAASAATAVSGGSSSSSTALFLKNNQPPFGGLAHKPCNLEFCRGPVVKGDVVYEVDSEMAPFTASVSLTPDTLFGSPALSKLQAAECADSSRSILFNIQLLMMFTGMKSDWREFRRCI